MVSANGFDPTLDYYQVLGVPVTATAEEIRHAYRELMRRCHPDRVRDPDQRRIAEERAKLLNAAYAVLGDPVQRRAYDEQLRQRAVAEFLFQRYTGPGPTGTRMMFGRRSRASLTYDLAAFVQLLAVTVIFVAALVLLLLASSAVSQLFAAVP